MQFHPEKSGEVGLQILQELPAAAIHQSAELRLSARAVKRIIACLDVRDGQVVKGINFEGLRSAGDPAELARRYNVEGIDELVILDITATLERRRRAGRHDPPRSRANCSSRWPSAAASGPKTMRRRRSSAGADKVSLNTAALSNPSLITTLANRYGSQAVARRHRCQARRRTVSPCTRRSGQTATDRDAVEWAREAEARGAGEILLTSIDRDGTEGRLRLPDDGSRIARR